MNGEPARDPWDSVNAGVGADLLLDVERFLSRFISYPTEHARVAHVLWIGHSHLMDQWDSTPRLAALSPEPGSGKTRILELTEQLVPRPISAFNVSASYIFRRVGDGEARPTLIYDEIDTVFGARTAAQNEDIRALLNAGHRRGAIAGRCVVKGKSIETEDFAVYCAVAMAGLGDLPETILTRSIVLRMRRRAPNERVEPFRPRINGPEGSDLRDRLVDWAESVSQREPFQFAGLPSEITDRDADVWESIVTVAELAGGGWPERARVAAVTFVTDAKRSTPSLGIKLLGDLRAVFGDSDQLPTEQILEHLHRLDESPWGDLRGKPLDARGLARRLRPYDIKPTTIRILASTAKGYRREDLFDAWLRYLPLLQQANVTSETNGTGTGTGRWNGVDLPPRIAADGSILAPHETGAEPGPGYG